VRTHSFVPGIVILIIAGGLFGTDLIVKELPRVQGMNDQEAPTEVVPSNPDAPNALSSSALSSETSSKPTVVKKGVSTKKQAGIDVTTVLSNLQLIAEPTNESGFLGLMATGKAVVVETHVLIRNNDRAFLFSWIDSNDAKSMFSSLKQELSEQFSGKMTDLIDTTKTGESGPPVDILSFTDPTLSAERVMFLRVRTRLYEIHIAKNGEDMLASLVAALSR